MQFPSQDRQLALAQPATDALARRAGALGIRLLAPGELAAAPGLILRAEGERLQLEWSGPNAPGPLRLDFAEPGMRRRLKGGAQQALARAIGIHQGRRRVLDATAGLGRDAFLMAGLGCEVRAAERDPIVALLLGEALERAAADPALAAIAGRIELLPGTAVDLMRQIAEGGLGAAPEVIYLDPMFPDRGKSAKAKKEMAYLRRLLGRQLENGADLIEPARRLATHRVVVKRSHRSPPLVDREKIPALATIASKLLRFDLYNPR